MQIPELKKQMLGEKNHAHEELILIWDGVSEEQQSFEACEFIVGTKSKTELPNKGQQFMTILEVNQRKNLLFNPAELEIFEPDIWLIVVLYKTTDGDTGYAGLVIVADLVMTHKPDHGLIRPKVYQGDVELIGVLAKEHAQHFNNTDSDDDSSENSYLN